VRRETGLALADARALTGLDAVILAVPHSDYMSDPCRLYAMLRPGGLVIDVRSALDRAGLPPGIGYWSL
jgi:UDP-N-acetyl-D-galactosamine dehydrogenase